MSLYATEWAWGQSVTVSEKLMLLYLAGKADGDHRCDARIDEIEKAIGLDIDVLGVRKSLTKKGLISHNHSILGQPTQYTIQCNYKQSEIG